MPGYQFIYKNRTKGVGGCIYRPPDSSNYLPKDFNKFFKDMLIKVNTLSMETFLLGDINANYNVKSSHKELKEIIKSQGFYQIVEKATRITAETKTLIDVILTNKRSNVKVTDVIPLSLSDHDCVLCVTKINHNKIPHRTIKCRNYAKYNHEDFQEDLRSRDWSRLYMMTNVNAAWLYFKQILFLILDKHAPTIEKRVKGKRCPWLPNDIKKDMNTRDQLLRKARKSNKGSDWSAYKTLKNRCNNRIKYARQKYHKKLKQAAFPLQNFIWKKPKQYDRRTDKTFKFEYVSKLFVERELQSLKRKKAAGWDNLPPGILKDAATVLSGPLAHIINLSLQTATVPTEWKIAKVTPIYKGGDTKDCGNFRPISVLPVLSKILEKAVHKQLIDYLENHKLLSEHQFGYRRRRSTELATMLLADSIRKEVDNGNLVGVLYIDLSKAFDTLNHPALLEKLSSCGINGTTHEWFSDYLFNRKQMCVVENSKSDLMSVTCGVPQGSILGPLLFLVYFNDLNECLKNSIDIEFADDTVIYIAGANKCIIENLLNNDLKNVSSYFEENGLVINLKKGKSESMLFGISKKLTKWGDELSLYYNETPIPATKEYKYLGTILDNTLSLNSNFN
ncbi:uncharacterized protein LOC130630019 [Hydractinia symbiolongicarpus]|uniref:uncharacterized protein LOC130630019 n=1 Tax=Hydractinia symbiolongicarpus TaxID=13093 RepID=UPI00254AFB9A|nr:uncharacterized protein LOC130630019 [Hydractinia symbiolongicarpus]